MLAPGKWTVEEKTPEVHPLSAAYDGPSARDLLGGDLNLSMSGEVHFGPEDMSPRQEQPGYGRKLKMRMERVGLLQVYLSL